MAYKKEVKENTEYSELKKAISSNALKPLYVLWGEEAYLKEHYYKEMKKLLLPDGLAEFNFKYFDDKNLDINALSAAVDMLPVFAERTLVEVRDFDFYKAGEETRERLESVIKDIPEYCCLVFFFSDPEFKPSANLKIHHTIKKVGSSVEFRPQSDADLTVWLARRFRALGHDIDREDAQYMIFLCGDSMTSLITEAEKIAAYCKTRKISRADIDAVGTPVISARVFDMTDAIAKRDFDRSASIMGDLLQLREPPIKLLAVIAKQLRQIYYAKLCMERGKDKAFLQALCEIKNEYSARLLMENARRMSLAWCENAVMLCADTDYRMKRLNTEDEELLTIMLIKLAVG